MSDIVDIDDASGAKRRKAGRPPRDPQDWTAAFLAYYRAKGNLHNAARAANVSVNTVAKHRRATSAFDAQVRLAYREYGAMLAEKLAELGVEKGNVIALIASLKGHSKRMAARYSEKAVDARVMNVIVNGATSAEPAAASDLMARLTGRLAPQEVRAMRGEVIDVTPLALPLASHPGDAPNDEEAR